MRPIDKPIKLAFVGAGCVGKTTLLNLCRRAFVGNSMVAFVEEAARIFFQNHSVSNKFTAEIQVQIQSIALQNEQIAHNSGAKLIFCDRSVIDAVVYVRAQGNKMDAEYLLERVQFWLPTYDKFLLLNPADISYHDDEVRQEGEDGRQEFHNVFNKFFDERTLPFELLSGSLEKRLQRINQILSEIRLYGHE